MRISSQIGIPVPNVVSLFSVIYSGTNKNLNNQFKDIVSAIEGYVRIARNDLNITLEKTIKTLNEEVPKDDRPLDRKGSLPQGGRKGGLGNSPHPVTIFGRNFFELFQTHTTSF